ncbi:MAG: arginine N-succinyltransferase [Phycisphaerales bacterium]|jgi:arginine N-succinyltransferase
MNHIRPAVEADLPSLLALAHTGNYINLPPFPKRLEQIVAMSHGSFRAAAASPTPPDGHERHKDRYLFVVDDGTGRCVGTSSIRGGMGSTTHPNLSFQLLKVVRRSEVLRKNDELSGAPIVAGLTDHFYAVLFQDPYSPTELGGNVLHPDMRSRGVGKLLSYSRFHYLREHSSWFSDRLLAEMMAPIEPYNDGNPFWRHVVRPFIGLSYQNADRLSTHDEQREFMYELLPRLVNLSLLSTSVLDTIGEVGPYTKSAEGMLRSIGFVDSHRIDPFDAGPHLETRLSTINGLDATPRAVEVQDAALSNSVDAIISSEQGGHGFHAVRGRVALTESGVQITPEIAKALGVVSGDTVSVSRLDFEASPPRKKGLGIPVIDLKAESERVLKANHDKDHTPLAALNVSDFAEIIERELDVLRHELRTDLRTELTPPSTQNG